MFRLLTLSLVLLLIGLIAPAMAQSKRQQHRPTKIFLREGWAIRSSAQLKEKGDVLSQRDFHTRDWYPAKVPSTVVGTLVDRKVYPDPFVGMNLRMMPGCNYPIGANFSLRPMPEDSPFRVSWWYRTEFQLPAGFRDRNIWLHLDGINFRANVWLNGKLIAGSDQIAGTFRLHELNIREIARAGELNTLAVEVFPALPDDLGWTWVDWNPMPPDKNMGIFRDVYLTTSGPVTLRYPQAVTHFDLPALETAHLTVNAEAHNATDHEVEGLLSGRIESVRFSQRIKLGPQETRLVSFTPDQFPQLNLAHPRVWWPVNLGAHNLYDLEMEFTADGKISDRQNTRFGVREITSELDKQDHRVFKINGKNILIRGGGWASDMFLREMPERLKQEFQYVKDMNLNTIRLEGQLQPDHFFDLADEYGILIMAGWCCCSHWEHWQHRDDYREGPVWDKEDYEIAAKSQADQIRRLRNHPSMLAWFNGSDNPPPADVEKMYVDILKKYQWPNPFISSATAKKAEFSGASGVKMEGPYEWVPASYWLLDREAGGAHGFATEISPGPAVPPLESLERMIPKEHLWPIDEYWNYHAGGGQFKNINVFTAALNGRYGAAKDVRDYAAKSQLMTYEGQRAMFEAYAGNRYKSTGVIQWMLNNAWPSLIWHLYDYYLMPAGGYFGTKKACEPIHVQYSYDDKSVVAVNTTYQPQRNLRLTAQVYDINLAEKFSKVAEMDLAADSNVKAFSLPEIKDLSAIYFLKLTLQNASGQIVSSNFYWLSTTDDVLDTKKTKWFYTPVSSYADMTQLEKLPAVKLAVSGRTVRRGGEEIARVAISNPSPSLAFFVHLQIKQGNSERDILPVVWQDNYVSLLPGERREITATYKVKDLGKAAATLKVEAWNSAPVKISLGSRPR
ncbi:MAG: exo,4-beta-D-glucosaminidase [Blastocatellia bacterium]|nr:exo,4-beta-D-glucosaminidase [Blastocatellia bacterium]